MTEEKRCKIIRADEVIFNDVIQSNLEPGDIRVTSVEQELRDGSPVLVKINDCLEMDGDKLVILVSRDHQVFKLVMVEPEKLVIYGNDGRIVQIILGEKSSEPKPDEYRDRALSGLPEQGWHVVSVLDKLGEPRTWYVLARKR